MTQAFELASEKYAAEIFEREVVVLDLIEGTYYALGGSAKEIWEQLTAKQPLKQIAADLAHVHGVSSADVEVALEAFSARLLEEGVLRTAAASTGEAANPLSPRRGGFAPPTVEKHVDMQDLLTLDPIHDVDPATGWPRT
jgi:hypothetical protein